MSLFEDKSISKFLKIYFIISAVSIGLQAITLYLLLK